MTIVLTTKAGCSQYINLWQDGKIELHSVRELSEDSFRIEFTYKGDI